MIIFLQNAWSPVYAGRIWPRRSWLRALARSRSGVRLKLLTDDLNVVHNVAPLCGRTAPSVMPANHEHVRAIITSCSPKVIVACGKHAEAALRAVWDGPLLCVPHPAHRVLTDGLYRRARSILDAGFVHQCALRQHRDGIALETLQ